jgi:hypothetical protein
MQTWEAVRKTMTEHLQGFRSGENNAWPSILIGLAHDGAGRRLTPVHTRKRSKIYRYYSSPADTDTSDPDKIRVKSGELENAVITGLKGFLFDEGRLLQFLDDENLNRLSELLQTARELHSALDRPNRELMQRCIQNIKVTGVESR